VEPTHQVLLSTSISTVRRYAVIVCPSVCQQVACDNKPVLYQNGYNLESRKQHRYMMAQGLFSFLLPKISVNLQWRHPQQERQIQVG